MTTANAATSGAGFLLAGAERPTFLEKLGRAWSDYMAYRRTLDSLQGLTNKQLGDVGMRRDSLDRIARAAVYGS